METQTQKVVVRALYTLVSEKYMDTKGIGTKPEELKSILNELLEEEEKLNFTTKTLDLVEPSCDRCKVSHACSFILLPNKKFKHVHGEILTYKIASCEGYEWDGKIINDKVLTRK